MESHKIFDALKVSGIVDSSDDFDISYKHPVDQFLASIIDSPHFCGVVRTSSWKVAYDIMNSLIDENVSCYAKIVQETFPLGPSDWIIVWEEDVG